MFASSLFRPIDWLVLAAYFAGMLAIGWWFWRRRQSSEEFTAAGRSLPGWLCGLSIFATYLSSISYLAIPGKAYASDWNAFGYSIALPLAALIAVFVFVPHYRRTREVSAYALLEHRFGLWARLYASGLYLLYQVARIGTVMYLMALPMEVLFGWDIRTLIVITGVVVTGYAFVGGITAVIWADAIQAVVLVGGAVLALAILVLNMPGGMGEVFRIAQDQNKFALGETSLGIWDQRTLWVMLAFGLFDNLRNFGVDQSYIQRYFASRSDREARKSVWVGALLYVPVSAFFLFIGTALFAYYRYETEDLMSLRRDVAEQRMLQADPVPSGGTPPTVDQVAASLDAEAIGDRVFPYFIATHLPPGIRGLLIAAIFAAAMSTVSTSLNSSATLVMSDFYRRLISPEASDRRQLWVLRGATIVWGVFGTLMSLVLVRLSDSILDLWWMFSGILGAGIVGLFLMSILCPALGERHAIGVLTVGTLLIGWMAVSGSDFWPESWQSIANPLHNNLVIVVGPCVMLCLAVLLGGKFQLGAKR